ncbi:hypothetical protein E5288_WYG020012 [Bos mutus]|uniref:5-azacytidine-induced protein 2 n=1 Tax=Bos mutus TaxID=72004 RepID=A0A6B0RJB2_9CETA|nr:hypothetical protein [Bos mutus]
MVCCCKINQKEPRSRSPDKRKNISLTLKFSKHKRPDPPLEKSALELKVEKIRRFIQCISDPQDLSLKKTNEAYNLTGEENSMKKIQNIDKEGEDYSNKEIGLYWDESEDTVYQSTKFKTIYGSEIHSTPRAKETSLKPVLTLGLSRATPDGEHHDLGEITGRAVMDALVEDDICILNHEKAHRRDPVTPVSIYSGDESVASHFALVTAYEDIKKRLKDSEKENSFLKKRIRILEEKLIGARKDEETSSVGREQVNKAYHAYREVCIDRDNLKSKLDKMNKDNSESLKVLNEQLQSKEVELLQLRTEVETQQVIRNLNPPSSNWEVEKLSCDLKIHGLEQELELLRKECRDLRIELQKAKQTVLPNH